MRILLAALILTLVLAAPVEAGPDLARKAFRKATQADTRSTAQRARLTTISG